MVIASGANRVDEAKLGRLADGQVRRASPETVKQATGYTIGGVPPLGHIAPLPIYIDQDLLQYETIYGAAGVPECVFPLTPDELVRATGGTRGRRGGSARPHDRRPRMKLMDRIAVVTGAGSGIGRATRIDVRARGRAGRRRGPRGGDGQGDGRGDRAGRGASPCHPRGRVEGRGQ